MQCRAITDKSLEQMHFFCFGRSWLKCFPCLNPRKLQQIFRSISDRKWYMFNDTCLIGHSSKHRVLCPNRKITSRSLYSNSCAAPNRLSQALLNKLLGSDMQECFTHWSRAFYLLVFVSCDTRYNTLFFRSALPRPTFLNPLCPRSTSMTPPAT